MPLTATPQLLEIAFPYDHVKLRWIAPFALSIAIVLILMTKIVTLPPKTNTIVLAAGFFGAGLSSIFLRYLFNWKNKPDIVEGLSPYPQQFTFSLHKDDSLRTRSIRKNVTSFEPSVHPLRFFSVNAALAPLAGRHSGCLFFLLTCPVIIINNISIIFGAASILGLCLCTRLYALLRPTYFRISPGHLEILRGWPWNDRIARAQVFSLFDKRIHVDLDGALLVLIDQEGKLELIGIGGVMQYDLMLEPIFEAAACGDVPLQTDPNRLVG